MRVSKDIAQELLDLSVGETTEGWEGDTEYNQFPVKFELMCNEIIDTSRWSVIYEVVYKDLDSGKYYYSTYSEGATECQDERPYEDDGEEIEFTEVVPKQVTVTKYIAVNKGK